MIRRTLAASLCLIGLVASATTSAGAQPSNQTSSGVFRWGGGGAVQGAVAHLVTNDAGATMEVRTAELAAEPHTVWWAVFNHPEYCAHPALPRVRCGGPDFGNPNVEASVLYAAGDVVGRRGTAGFAGRLNAGDTSGALVGPGLVNPRGAEIHLVIRSHGPTIPHMVEQQIHSFNGGCAPGDPNHGLCRNAQFAAFAQ